MKITQSKKKGRARRKEALTACNPSTSKYKAPTTGLEDNIYGLGTAKHAAQYSETTEKLCNYIQANFKSGAT